MAGNSFGEFFRVTTYGESHGRSIGLILDGCPPGIAIDEDLIQIDLDRRRPGQSHITTQRKESDRVQIHSGVFKGVTTGTPIFMMIPNEDQRSADYTHISEAFRPSHADFTYQKKYGIRDYRGGGRSSARETAARVAAGALAKAILGTQKVTITAYVSRVGHITTRKSYREMDLAIAETNLIRCPDLPVAQEMIEEIESVRKKGDTVGGVITCIIQNCPIGLGEPVFDKLHADLAKAMLSINAVQGFEYGSGFEGTYRLGSENNDLFYSTPNPDHLGEMTIHTRTNHSGGIQGGISNGEDIYFNTAFKPVATVMQEQASVDKKGNAMGIQGKGRHDPCVLPRAVPIVEAMASLVLADHFLRYAGYQSLKTSGEN